jgi:phosphoglycerate kinase
MFNKKTIRDVDVDRKKVLLRVDFNVPLKDGKVADDTRIRASLPTIRYLLDHHAALIVCSHLGRPKGKVVPEMSLKPAADRLGELLGFHVTFVGETVGATVKAAVEGLRPGGILVLENTRFSPQETENDPAFAAELASLADVYVNDAFGSAHRAHASTEGVAHILPGVAGFLMEAELTYLSKALQAPEHPFVAILGGAKISDKIGVVESLLRTADTVLVGGGMANTFLAAKGLEMGDSLVESDSIGVAKKVLESAGDKIVLPVDAVVAQAVEAGAQNKVVPVENVEPGWRILDIGPQAVAHFSDALKGSKLVVWNGPMGVFELTPFDAGTNAIARAVATSGATTIIGGGDSIAAVKKAGVEDKISHISTGGGASLEFLEGKTLPGVSALQDRAA